MSSDNLRFGLDKHTFGDRSVIGR